MEPQEKEDEESFKIIRYEGVKIGKAKSVC